MTAPLFEQILATVTQALPRLFLIGAPVLVVLMAMAAFFDTRMPFTSTGEHATHPSPPAG